MNFSVKFKRIIFFWSAFHILGYFFYLTGFNPSIQTEEIDYINNDKIYYSNYIFNNPYDEGSYFWPFHKFIKDYDVDYDAPITEYTEYLRANNKYRTGFLGVYGYYGHHEFLLYMVLPFLIFGLAWFYKKYIN